MDRSVSRPLLADIVPAVLLVLGLGAGLILTFALGSYNVQAYVILLMVTGFAAAWLIPRAARKEPSVSISLLTAAFAVKVVGSLARYLALVYLYGGVGDANRYHRAGVRAYEMVRALDFSFLQPPFLGTPSVDYAPAFLYALIGPTMLGGFLAFAMAAFTGTWLFYRAHRIAFPDGHHRLYFLLLFFLPAMWFWPSSIGKDALIVFGLGMATYGLAQLNRRFSVAAAIEVLAGGGIAYVVRPPVAAIFVVAAVVGFLIRPGGHRSPFSRPVAWLVAGPFVVAGLILLVRQTGEYLFQERNVQTIGEYLEHSRENLSGGSQFSAPIPESPAGIAQATVTVLFRPFPWEVGSPLGVLAGVEGLIVLGVFAVRLRAGIRAILTRWRGGTIVAVVISAGGIIVALTGIANFGLLLRQRAQLLPFFFMVFTAAPRVRGGLEPGTGRRAKGAHRR